MKTTNIYSGPSLSKASRLTRAAARLLSTTALAAALLAPGDGFAQLAGAPQPTPAPALVPGPVASPARIAPAAPVSLGPPPIVPQLPTPATLPPLKFPTIVLATPLATPTPPTYNCSCNGSASYTRWMGTISAPDTFQARESAVNECLAFNFNRRPASPFIAPPVFNFFPVPPPPLAASAAEPGLPNLQAPGLSGFALLNSPRAFVLNLCQNCTCD